VPLSAYAIQLILNAAWTPLFFGLRRPGLAAIEISMVWASILATIWFFYPVSPAAAWLLVPYLVWVSFAAAFNISIWRRNLPPHVAKGAP
jgi:translocator protein